MMSIRLLFVVFLPWLLLGGCASLSKDECLNADWRTIGYGDASEGYERTRINEHRQSCAQYNVRPDLDAYTRGYEDGLRVYCTAPKGYQQGVRGYTYRGICPRDLEGPFMEAYSFGREIYQTRNGIKSARGRRGRAAERLAAIEEEIAHTEAALIKGNMPPPKRALLLEDLKRLSEDKQATEREIYDLDQAIQDLRHRLAEMMANNPWER